MFPLMNVLTCSFPLSFFASRYPLEEESLPAAYGTVACVFDPQSAAASSAKRSQAGQGRGGRNSSKLGPNYVLVSRVGLCGAELALCGPPLRGREPERA
jgi:hypothetical protein